MGLFELINTSHSNRIYKSRNFMGLFENSSLKFIALSTKVEILWVYLSRNFLADEIKSTKVEILWVYLSYF